MSFFLTCIALTVAYSEPPAKENVYQQLAVNSVTEFLEKDSERIKTPQLSLLRKHTLEAIARSAPIETICWTHFYQELKDDDTRVGDVTLVVIVSANVMKMCREGAKQAELSGMRIALGDNQKGSLNVVVQQGASHADEVFDVLLIRQYDDERGLCKDMFRCFVGSKSHPGSMTFPMWGER